MCQPNNCVAVLQRLRGGWQVCQMQTPKPLKGNSRVHLSSSISRAQDHRKPPKKVSISEWLQCNFDYCNHLTLLDRRGAFKAHPTHRKRQRGTDTEHCPKPWSEHWSLATRKPRPASERPTQSSGRVLL